MRVPEHTAGHVDEEVRRRTEENVTRYAVAGPGAINRRLAGPDREWGIERALGANAATVALIGLGLGTFLGYPPGVDSRRSEETVMPFSDEGLVVRLYWSAG
jgi:hypothetical protein